MTETQKVAALLAFIPQRDNTILRRDRTKKNTLSQFTMGVKSKCYPDPDPAFNFIADPDPGR